MKALIATACICVIAASGFYFHDRYEGYQAAKHEAECKKMLSAGQGFVIMAEETRDPVWQGHIERNAKEMVAKGCEL